MRRDRGITLVRRLAAFALLAGIAMPGWAAPDSPGHLQRLAVERLAEATAADPEARRPARELLSEAGFAPPVPGGLTPLPQRGFEEIVTRRFDLRIVLGLLAQAFGHEDNSAVLEAQADNGTSALLVDRGTLRLTDLAHVMGDDAVSGAGVLELRAPVILWHDAELRVTRDEVLQLSRTHGAFILNFGRLIVDGGDIRGVGGQSPHNEEFTPFVATSGPGTVQMRDARISDLGFGSTVKFSGLSVARTPLDRPAAPSFITGSVIERVRRISVQAAQNLTIDNNRIIDAGSAALVILHSFNTTVTANLVAGTSKTNAIRVLDGSVGTRIAGNAILHGDRVGILVKNAANLTFVENNIVWGRDGSGIKIDRAKCAHVARNILIGNRQKGIEVRRSLEALLVGNTLVGNRSAGIWVSGQPTGAVTRIEDNLLDANGSGVATATAAAIVLEGNDFSAQFPKFLDGDLAVQSRYIASDIKGRAPIALNASGPVSIAGLPRHCESGR